MTFRQNDLAIEIGGYIGEWRQDHYMILGRGIQIGQLRCCEENWIASRCTLDRARAQEEIRDPDPREAIRGFLKSEGWVTGLDVR